MSKSRSIFKSICAIALLALAAGCATGNPDRDKTAIAAGFKIVSPNTPEQKALYAKLPKDTVSPVQYKGGIIYVMRDSSNGMALVGNAAQYSVYQEMRNRQHIAHEDLQEAQINELNNVDWGAWGGGAVFVGGFGP